MPIRKHIRTMLSSKRPQPGAVRCIQGISWDAGGPDTPGRGRCEQLEMEHLPCDGGKEKEEGGTDWEEALCFVPRDVGAEQLEI